MQKINDMDCPQRNRTESEKYVGVQTCMEIKDEIPHELSYVRYLHPKEPITGIFGLKHTNSRKYMCIVSN